jgi:hypothetical protein
MSGASGYSGVTSTGPVSHFAPGEKAYYRGREITDANSPGWQFRLYPQRSRFDSRRPLPAPVVAPNNTIKEDPSTVLFLKTLLGGG